MTPNSDSNRGVTADLVKTRRSSSNAVEVNPDDLSININKAYVESHKKKSTLSKFIPVVPAIVVKDKPASVESLIPVPL